MKILIFIAIYLLIATLTYASSISFPINWNGGHCSICGGSSGAYACSNGYGNWNNGVNYFNDPIPPNNIITNITVDLYGEWGCEGNNAAISVSLGNQVVKIQNAMGQCSCNLCDPVISFSSNNMNVFSNYSYGSVNSLTFSVPQGLICVNRAIVTLEYASGNQQYNPPPSCDSFGGCVNGNCVLSNNGPYCNCTTNWYGPNCQCYFSPEQLVINNPPILDAPSSGFKEMDTMFVSFNNSVKYFGTSVQFKNELNNTCDFPQVSDAVVWSTKFDPNTCSNKLVGKIPWRTAWPICMFNRTLTNDWLVFNGEMIVTNFENIGQLSPTRPDPIVRKITSTLPFTVRFPTSVSLDCSPVTVYSFVEVLGAITEQSFNSDPNNPPGTATITLLSTVQRQYYLTTPLSVQGPNGVTVSLNGNPNVGDQCLDDGSLCKQYWTVTIKPQNGKCDFNGLYRVNFTVNCKPSQQSNCPLDQNTNKASLSFSLTSSNLCPQVIDNIDVSGSMLTYSDNSYNTPKNDFILNQKLYFKTQVSSTKATIVSSQVTQFSVKLWDGTIVTLLDIFNTPQGTLVNLNVVNNYNGAPNSHLEMIAHPDLFAVGRDSLKNVQFMVTLSVTYDNTQRRSLFFVTSSPKSQQLLTSTSVSLKSTTVSAGNNNKISLLFYVITILCVFTILL